MTYYVSSIGYSQPSFRSPFATRYAQGCAAEPRDFSTIFNANVAPASHVSDSMFRSEASEGKLLRSTSQEKEKKVSLKRKRDEADTIKEVRETGHRVVVVLDDASESQEPSAKKRKKDPAFNPPKMDPKNKTFLNENDIILDEQNPYKRVIRNRKVTEHLVPGPVKAKAVPDDIDAMALVFFISRCTTSIQGLSRDNDFDRNEGSCEFEIPVAFAALTEVGYAELMDLKAEELLDGLRK